MLCFWTLSNVLPLCKKRAVFLDTDRKKDDIQKDNNCIICASSEKKLEEDN
jgi:hypothetical protein